MVSRSIALFAILALGANATNTSSSTTAAVPSYPTGTNCDQVRSDCQSKPDANQATCAALYAQCAGTTSGLNKPSVTTSATPSSTAKVDCEKVRSDCQSQPNANQATCAALFAQCAGTTSGLNKPYPSETTVDYTVYTTVCPATSIYTSGTQIKTTTYTTTSTITSCKGGCPAKPTTSAISYCDNQYNICRVPQQGGSGNQAACAAEYAACKASTSAATYPATATTAANSTIPATPATKTGSSAAPSSTIDACQNAYNICRVPQQGGSGNQASCAAEFAACKAASSSAASKTTMATATASGSVPASTTGVAAPPQFTGAAAMMKPVGGLMAAAAAVLVIV